MRSRPSPSGGGTIEPTGARSPARLGLPTLLRSRKPQGSGLSSNRVGALGKLVQGLIHGVRHLVGRVPRQVLRERLGIELAARLPCAARMPFRSSKTRRRGATPLFSFLKYTREAARGHSSAVAVVLEIPPLPHIFATGASLRSDRQPHRSPRAASGTGVRVSGAGGGGAAQARATHATAAGPTFS